MEKVTFYQFENAPFFGCPFDVSYCKSLLFSGSSFFPKSPVLFPSNAAASRLAEHAQDVSGPAGIHTSPWETYSFSQLAMH